MNTHSDFTQFKKQLLNDPATKREYDRLEPEFAIIRALLDARVNEGLTQKQLAEKLGTKQSAIARLESGRANPSIRFLKRVADALGRDFRIQI